MAIETGIERAIMLADFGELVTFTPFGGSSVSITGIFDSTYEAIDSGGSVSFAVEQPRLTVKTSDVSGVAEGDLLRLGHQITLLELLWLTELELLRLL